jgi:hypothetical protein
MPRIIDFEIPNVNFFSNSPLDRHRNKKNPYFLRAGICSAERNGLVNKTGFSRKQIGPALAVIGIGFPGKPSVLSKISERFGPIRKF